MSTSGMGSHHALRRKLIQLPENSWEKLSMREREVLYLRYNLNNHDGNDYRTFLEVGKEMKLSHIEVNNLEFWALQKLGLHN